MRAFDKLLTDHPEWKGKAVLIQIAIPKRSDIEEYKTLRRQVEEMVGMINGKYNTSLCWMHLIALNSLKFTNETIQGLSPTLQLVIFIIHLGQNNFMHCTLYQTCAWYLLFEMV